MDMNFADQGIKLDGKDAVFDRRGEDDAIAHAFTKSTLLKGNEAKEDT